MDLEFITKSAQETMELGGKIGSQLKGGEVFAISGQLGSGKTHLIKGICAGAGAAGGRHDVNSPTFVLVNEYEGRFHIYHIDAYRLNSTKEFEMLGFDDYCRPDSIVLIEWADKVQQSLSGINFISVELKHRGEFERSLKFLNLPQHIKFIK